MFEQITLKPIPITRNLMCTKKQSPHLKGVWSMIRMIWICIPIMFLCVIPCYSENKVDIKINMNDYIIVKNDLTCGYSLVDNCFGSKNKIGFAQRFF